MAMAKRKKKTLSPEERAKRNSEASAKLEAGVAKILDSEEFENYLRFVARFHDYSWGNVMMILTQDPEATLVAGYAAWQKSGRQVRKGEKGIVIRSPRFRKKSEREEDDEKRPAYFALATVFDVRQTEGDELPKDVVDAVELTGESDEGSALYALGKSYCARENIDLKMYSDLEANGIYVGSRGKDRQPRIALRRGMELDQTARTLVHEIVHHELHKDAKYLERETAEIEAEGTAFVVCSHFGLDTSSYSFGYVVSWAKDKEKFKGALRTIQKTSDALIRKLEDFEAPSLDVESVDEVA